MAMILAFQPRFDRPQTRPEKTSAAASAHIIIFPGVRYERLYDQLDERRADDIYSDKPVEIAKNCKIDLKSA